MIESAARAERLETQPAASPCYVWEVPQKPISIRISLDVIDRLDREVVENFRSVRSRGSEIGGLLLGRNVPGTPPAVVIEEFDLIPCDYSRGPLYRLGESDKERFDAAIQKRGAAASGVVLVGLFRSNTRKGLTLEPEDIAFFNERCSDPQNVYLLIKPFATKASMAGFFFRENGSVHAEASYLEFPFDRAELMNRVAEGTAQISAAPKGAARAQVVPIAVKRDTPAAATEESAPVPAPAPTVKPVEQPAAAAKPSAPAAKPSAPEAKETAPRAKESTPAKPSAPAKQNTPEAKESAPAKQNAPAAKQGSQVAKQAAPASKPASDPVKPAAEKAPEPVKAAKEPAVAPAPAPAEQPAKAGKMVDAPAISYGSTESEDAGGSRKLIWILGGAAALVAIFLLLVYPGFLLRRSRPEEPSAAKVDMAALALRAERNAGQLILTWNREAQVVKTAKKAMLAISDGTQRENVDIDLAQLQNGSIVYTPVTADVSFRLEVTGPDGKPQSEYVRVLGNRPSAMPTDTKETPGGGVQNAVNTQPQPAANDAQQVEAVDPEPAPAPSTPRASLADRLRPAKPSELKELALAEPPKLEHGQPAAGMSFGLGQSPNVPPPVSAPTRPAPPAQPLKVGGQVKEAVLVKRVEPSYPALARQARVRGVVQLEATVGRDGRVREVKVVNGHPLLRQAAVDAVKQWIYTPSLLNGAPVEVVTKVDVGFNFQGN